MLDLFYQDVLLEAGCDEAGRGCLAGAVFAAAVILPKGFFHPLLNDSKKLTAVHRSELKCYIETNAYAFSVASVDETEIDHINILNASFKAMHLAIAGLKQVPELLLIDGNRFKKYQSIPHECIVKGDGKFASIAAASILAKTYRDAYMQELHREYPQYGWDVNKGYGTAFHRQALLNHGMSRFHRKSFQCIPVQTSLW